MSRLGQTLKSVALTIGRAIPLVGGLVVLALLVAWISGMFNTRIPPGEESHVVRTLGERRVEQVNEVNKEYIEEAVGTLKAASRSVISARVLATIDEIHVVAGDRVDAGDLLVSLNQEEFKTQLSQAQQSLASAEAAAVEAKNDFERLERLLASRSVSQREFDAAQSRLTITQADQRRAEQKVEEARVRLGYCQIAAPKAGRIVDRLAEPGDTTQPGQPLLTLYDESSLRLETPVIEARAVQLKVGDRVTVHVDSVNRDFEAIIDEVVPQADAASRSFLVKASLPPAEDLYEGMFGRLQISAGTRKHLCLATAAIERVGQLEFVDVVLDDGTLQRRLIKTGRMGMPGHVEVLSGLSAGTRVALHSADDGQSQESADDE